MILISGPIIARRHAASRKWAFQHLARGTFGRTVTLNGIHYASLEAVENYTGLPFSEPQLAAATAGYADRVVVLDGEA
jgi:hypothetical protein